MTNAWICPASDQKCMRAKHGRHHDSDGDCPECGTSLVPADSVREFAMRWGDPALRDEIREMKGNAMTNDDPLPVMDRSGVPIAFEPLTCVCGHHHTEHNVKGKCHHLHCSCESFVRQGDVNMSNHPSEDGRKSIGEHEGNKYLRLIHGASDVNGSHLLVDVYEVLVAFDVTCPARQHAIKKLLCAGIRGKGGERADLIGAMAALQRAIDLVERNEKTDA